MNKSKLLKVVAELSEESLQKGFSVRFNPVGNSMWPLLSPRDILIVKKAGPEDIRIGDVIIWHFPKNSTKDPIVHRVVGKNIQEGMIYFQTKGDFNFTKDDKTICYNDILGRVTLIKKKKHDIDLETITGKAESIIYFLFALACLPLKYTGEILRVVISLFYQESDVIHSDLDISLRSNIGISTEDWLKCVYWAKDRINHDGVGKDIADVQAAGGFSEEALGLIRRGVRVEAVDLFGDDRGKAKYDCVIFAREINICHPENYADIFKKLSACLKPEGRLLFSLVNVPEKVSNVLRRRIWSIIKGKHYKGPSLNDITCGNEVLKHNVTPEIFRKATAEAGLTAAKIFRKQNVFCAELSNN